MRTCILILLTLALCCTTGDVSPVSTVADCAPDTVWINTWGSGGPGVCGLYDSTAGLRYFTVESGNQCMEYAEMYDDRIAVYAEFFR